MGWSSGSQFELRPDGNTLNGIGFDGSFGGVDYSQQSAAQISVADGVTNGTTTVTSATASFAAVHVGNGLNIASDGLYQVVAVVNATTVTVDRATANGGAGRSMKLGGAGTISTNGFDPVHYGVDASKKTWIRLTNSSSGTASYSPTSTALVTTAGSVSNPTTYEGYSTTRGDGGRAHIAQAAMNSFTIADYCIVKNLFLDGAAAGWTGPVIVASGTQCYFSNIYSLCTPGSGGVAGNGITVTGAANRFDNCLVDGGSIANATALVASGGSGATFVNCEFRNVGTSAQGAVWLGTGTGQTYLGCIWANNKGACVRTNAVGSSAIFKGCIFSGTTNDSGTFTGDGIQLTATQGLTAFVIQNCIFNNNAGYEVRHSISDATNNVGAAEWMKATWKCNWFHDTGIARYFQLPANPNDNALTADPFTSSSTGNFSLNSAAGGGALISSTLCTTNFVDGVNTASLMAGFYGTQPTSSSSATMISLWRELTNERSTVAVPDSTVAVYLDWGLQALNRASRYHYTTDTTTLTLVANQQEYAAPADMLDIRWIRFGLKELQKGDVERWRNDDLNWSQEPVGEPREWAQYGLQIVLRPAPSAEAVAANPTCTMRYVSNPPAILTSGPDQLSSSAWRLAVIYGAYLWSVAYPDTVMAQSRAAGLKQEFEEGAQLFQSEMAGRNIGS